MAKKIYEHNFTVPLIVALVALAALLGVYFSMDRPEKPPAETTTEPEETTTEPEEPEEKEPMPPVTFKSDLSAYESAMTASDEKYLVLINKQNKVTASFVPAPLAAVADTHKSITLEATAARALEAMFIEMRAAGVGGGVFVTSAYRTYAYQQNLFDGYIKTEKSKNPALTNAEAREKVLRYSAEPGTSEHQSGLSVDLMTTRMADLDESFAKEPVFAWLSENAWKFGFVLRFPADKTEITTIQFEPWHWRYVGRYHAKKIHDAGVCLEEYIAMLSEE